MKIDVFRLVVAVFVLFLVLFISWREMVNPVFTGIAACFHTHNVTMNEIYERAITSDDLALRKQVICAADVESTQSLRGCLRELKANHWLGDMIINDIPSLGWNTKKRINFGVRDHNRMCPDVPIAEERV